MELTKSQMINRIAELSQENAELKEEIKYLEEEKKEKIQLLEQIIKNLYPNASDDELFTITFNCEYIDKLKKLQHTLQEIKELINACMEFRACERCKSFKMCDKDLEGCILSLITKAEEE